MIKVFVAHRCRPDSHKFIDWIRQQLKAEQKDIQFDVFVACSNETGEVANADDINRHLGECHIFLPVVTADFSSSTNAVWELEEAQRRRSQTRSFPLIQPLLLGATDDQPSILGFTIRQPEGEGDIWEDFTSEVGHEEKYLKVLARISNFLVRHNLLAKTDFYRDIELINIVLGREAPTPFEIRTGIQFLQVHPDYADYFFRHLENPIWLAYLKPYGIFLNGPAAYSFQDATGSWIRTPHWPILDFLEKVSMRCDSPEMLRFAEDILEIVRRETGESKEKERGNQTTNFYFAKILTNLPNDVIRESDIDLVESWLNSGMGKSLISGHIAHQMMGKFANSANLNDIKKAESLFLICTDYDRVGSKKGEFMSNMETFWLDAVVRKFAKKVGSVASLSSFQTLCDRVEYLSVVDPAHENLSYLARPSIEDDEQNHANGRFDHLLISSLRDTLKGALDNARLSLEPLLKEMLIGKSVLIRRIAICVLTPHIGKLPRLLPLVITKSNFEDPARPELFRFLKGNFRSLEPKLQNDVLDALFSANIERIDGEEENITRARFSIRWLAAIESQGNARADKAFEEARAIMGGVPSHPEFSAFTEVGWRSPNPPIKVEELNGKSVSDVAKYVADFKEDKGWDGSKRRDLIDVLTEAIKTDPKRYLVQLAELKSAHPILQWALLRAAGDLMREKRAVDHTSLVRFIRDLFITDTFWLETKDIRRDEIRSAVYDGLRYLRDWAEHLGGSADDENLSIALFATRTAITKSHLLDAGDRKRAVYSDALEVFFDLVLVRARWIEAGKRDRTSLWAEMGPVLEAEIGGERRASASPIAASNIDLVGFCSREWLEKNIHRIFPTNPDERDLLRESLSAYLANVSRLNITTYKLLKDTGILEIGLDSLQSTDARRKLLEIISLAFLLGIEPLEDAGLFSRVMKAWNYDDLKHVIHFFWMLRDANLEREKVDRILLFWAQCHDKVKTDPPKHARLVSDLSLLSCFLINRTTSAADKERLVLVMPFVEIGYHSGIVFDYLDRLADTEIDAVSEACLQMSRRVTPTFPEERVQSVVKKIATSGRKKEAIEICSNYARAGHVGLLSGVRKEIEK